MTAPGGHTIPAAISFNAKAGSHIATFNELDDPGPMTETFETVPATALQSALIEAYGTRLGVGRLTLPLNIDGSTSPLSRDCVFPKSRHGQQQPNKPEIHR